MPKASPYQPSFSAGEFSPKVQGRSDSERYKAGASVVLNYIPTIQGPLVRRPGWKYVGNNVKDPSKPPAFIEFKFSQTQNYILECGDKYMRFYTNQGQITTTSTHFKVMGLHGSVDVGALITFNSSQFYAQRRTFIANPAERVITSSVIVASSILEIETPWAWPDVHDIKFAQKMDTLYVVHSSYPEFKLQRLGNELWDLKQVKNEDGPYLPFNSYKLPGDSQRVILICGVPSVITGNASMLFSAKTGTERIVSLVGSSPSGEIRITSNSHGFYTGDRVVVENVFGTTEANNGTSTISAMFWNVKKVTDNIFDLADSVQANAYVGSGSVYPALFDPPVDDYRNFGDIQRTIAFINEDGGRAWGRIMGITAMNRFTFYIDSTKSPALDGVGSNLIFTWALGVWSRNNGYPNAITFHQDRKILSGTPAYPQEIDGSVIADYDNFQSSGSSFIVSDNNALQFNLTSDQLNPIHWLKSDTQGLLAGSFSSEWNMAPNNQAAALTPTNFNAQQTSYFGSHTADAVQTGNATLYIQRAQQRVREMNYFFQVNTYRSTDLAELSDHLINPGLKKLSVQKESIPVVWGLRTDGNLVSMSYGRDDVTLKVGWARHQLGGQSDSGGTAPVLKTIATIPAPDGTFDQVWAAVQRYINGTSVVTVEYMTKVFDDRTAQEDAFQLDCGATYNDPKTITGISTGSALVSCSLHGFANDDLVKINEVVGLNSSVVDVNAVIHSSNLVNASVFTIASASTNAFFLKDVNSGQFVDTRSYSIYISGGVARKLVSTISGLTWLKNEFVSVLADGGIHPMVQVNSAGVLALQYPVAKAQVGYPYNSDGKSLRADVGAADGSAMGKLRRPSRVAFMLNNVGDFAIGPSFDRLTPLDFMNADEQPADRMTPLFSGITREGIECEHNFDGFVCWRQNSPLPGMVQGLTVMLEENDV